MSRHARVAERRAGVSRRLPEVGRRVSSPVEGGYTERPRQGNNGQRALA